MENSLWYIAFNFKNFKLFIGFTLLYEIFKQFYDYFCFSGICNGRCCNREAEEHLQVQAREDFHSLIHHHSRTLQGLLATTADALRGKSSSHNDFLLMNFIICIKYEKLEWSSQLCSIIFTSPFIRQDLGKQ